VNREFEIVNGILVDLFQRILDIEEEALMAMDIDNLTMKEIHTIEAIGVSKDGRNMGDIAKTLKITVGTLTTAINRLVKKDFVERYRTDSDRRVVMVKLNDRGREIYRKHNAFHTQMTAAVVRKFGDNELLMDSLADLKDFFSNYHPEENTF